MKFEFYLTIVFVAICNVLLYNLIPLLSDFPIWAFYLMVSIFNVVWGFVLMYYLIEEGSKDD